MRKIPAQILIREARTACEAVAVGPFAPVVFERYNFIGGERGWLLGYPTETAEGRSAIVWTHQAAVGAA